MFVACTAAVESSAAGSDTTRDRPLTPLTVGIHEFEAVLFKGEVARRWRGGREGAGLEVGIQEFAKEEAEEEEVVVAGVVGTVVAFAGWVLLVVWE